MLKRYKDILDKAKSAELSTLSMWYSLFRIKEDPFIADLTLEEIDYFVNREEIVESIIYDIGVATRGIPITVVLVGPTGSGKTTLIQYISKVMEKLAKQNPKTYSFPGSIINFNQSSEIDDEVNKPLNWLNKSNSEYSFIFFNDIKVLHLRVIREYFSKVKFKGLLINSFDLEDVLSEMNYTPKIVAIDSLTKDHCIELLNKRLEYFIDKERIPSITNLINGNAIDIIYKYSMGNPLLLLSCISKSFELKMSIFSNEKNIDKNELVIDSEIALKACMITKCFNALEDFEAQSKAKKELLIKMLNIEWKSPTQLSSIFLKDRTTISRYLNELYKSKLINQKSRGRESLYKITLPLKILLEKEYMKIIEKFKER